MKKIKSILMATLLMAGSLCAMSCSKDNGNDDQPSGPSTVFAFHYNGAALDANATVELHPSMAETENDYAQVNFIVENKTNSAVHACLKMERTEGSGANEVELCYNHSCRIVTLGTVTESFPVTPGSSQANTITYDYTPSHITGTVVYRLTIGEGAELKNPQVVYLKHTL